MIESERLATIGQLMGGVIHNLSTPLMGSMGQLMINERKIEALSEEFEKCSVSQSTSYTDLINEIKKHNNYIKEYIYYMGDLVEAIKSQLRSSANGMEEKFKLQELYDKISLLIAFELKKNRMKIKYDMANELKEYVISGEMASLVQILVNLVKNAIDSYSEEPGTIEINSCIYSENNAEKFIRIAVKDYGCGISNEVKAKMFKQMITTKGTKGTGIGLYLSNVMVKAKFGGHIDFESESGKGTTVYVWLPMNLNS